MKRTLINRLISIDTKHEDAREAAILLQEISKNLEIVIVALNLPMPINPTLFQIHELDREQKILASLLCKLQEKINS